MTGDTTVDRAYIIYPIEEVVVLVTDDLLGGRGNENT